MRIWQFIGLSLVHVLLCAFTPHIEELQHVPCPVQKYQLIDLGETTLSTNRLTRLQQGISYAPSINNRSEVVWNGSEGGKFKSLRKEGEDFIPRYEGMKLWVMGINDKSDLLIALERGFESFEWLLWRYDGKKYLDRHHIHTIDPFAPDLIFCALNSDCQVVGYFKKEELIAPATWNMPQGVTPLGKEAGLAALGKARAVNDKNTVAGLFEELKVYSPFVWNEDTGFEVMRNYRDKLFPVGWMEFTDILLTPDDVVYGNYWLKHAAYDDGTKGFTPHYGFVWNPHKSTIEQLELEGMRLTSVNSQHALVGRWQGRAAMRERDRRPVLLESLMSLEALAGWELHEATDINDRGEIVGFGTHEGQMHTFLAVPL